MDHYHVLFITTHIVLGGGFDQICDAGHNYANVVNHAFKSQHS